MQLKINKKLYERGRKRHKVSLKDLQNITDAFLNEVKSYSIKKPYILYGITQNPDTKDYIMVLDDEYCGKCGERYTNVYIKWCKSCQIDNLKSNIVSGNEKIDNLIQEMQLKINGYNDLVFEWIPYNQFNDIEKKSKYSFTAAIWKDGPLKYNRDKKLYERGERSHRNVSLKHLQNNTDAFLNEVKSYSIKKSYILYGITQNPDTKDYIMVFKDEYCEKCGEKYADISCKWCKPCQIDNLKINFSNWTSGNEKIDDLIQEMQLEINKWNDIVFEWIPYNQFDYIKEIDKNGCSTVYSAIWKEGPLKYDENEKIYKRSQCFKVALKYSHNSQ
ncbi:hypothetical protein C1645_828787, partial [Glomus cerebriforme]